MLHWALGTFPMNKMSSIAIAALICALTLTSFAEATTPFSLGHQDDGFNLYVGLPTESKEVVFAKEPDFGDHKVVRSAIVTGPGEKDFIGYAWDHTAEKLWDSVQWVLDIHA